jgi:predicted ATPase/transcriptional regulator with XRE-family HTH domain
VTTATDGGPAVLADFVRNQRLRAGLSQEGLAERAGLSVETVGKLERGLRRRLYSHTARALADALGLDDAERAVLAEVAAGRAGSMPGPRRSATPIAVASTGDLPPSLTSFVGREHELTAAGLLLARGVRLLTLTGPGGAGKTRLAVEGARVVGPQFPDGVEFVEFASLADPALVAQTVAAALGVRDAPGRSFVEGIVVTLRQRRLLLILDNCEHLLAGCTALVSTLLRECPHVTVVATSRERLRVTGEHVYPVPALALPPAGWTPDDAAPAALESLAGFAAVALFVDRARAVRPDFALTAANAASVAEICRRLDGLPLALELAAARIRMLSPQALLERLDQRLALLTGGARDLTARQRTLQNTIAWSYDLLTASEQRFVRRLAAFQGGCTLAAAEAVCSDQGAAGTEQRGSEEYIPSWDVLDAVESLVDKSLLGQRVAENGEPRFTMLETIHEFALAELAASGEEEQVRAAHADYFTAFVESAVLDGPGRGEATRRLEADHANLRTALNYSSATADGSERLLRIAAALGYYWFLQGHTAEGRAWCEAALARPEAADHPALRARVLFGAGQLAWDKEELITARALLEASASGAREAGDRRCQARALYVLGEVLWQLGDVEGARTVTEESVACAGAAGHFWELGLALQYLGMQAFRQGDLAGARTRYEQSLAQLRLAEDPSPAAYVLRNLGYVAVAERRHEEARQHILESLTINREIDDLRGIAGCLAALAGLAIARVEPASAAQLSGAMEAMLERAGASALHPRDRFFHERTLAAQRDALGDEAAAALRAEGRAMDLEAAVALARPGRDQVTGVGTDAP